mmetsp:Transcript_47053/g.109706  ORF Transcript_47053/g.109706 Transcript_47053/m.109706 type:complete len:204 (+) Transcript_47053:238-849(+)
MVKTQASDQVEKDDRTQAEFVPQSLAMNRSASTLASSSHILRSTNLPTWMRLLIHAKHCGCCRKPSGDAEHINIHVIPNIKPFTAPSNINECINISLAWMCASDELFVCVSRFAKGTRLCVAFVDISGLFLADRPCHPRNAQLRQRHQLPARAPDEAYISLPEHLQHIVHIDLLDHQLQPTRILDINIDIDLKHASEWHNLGC